MPDGSAIHNVNLVECSSHEQVAPPFRGENGLHHVAMAFRSFRQAEIWVAGQLVLDPKIKSLPLVKVPSESEHQGNWTGNFRDKIVRRVKKHGVCYLFSEATPAFCMPETSAVTRVIGRFCENHHVVILYKNGCQESDFVETATVQFMPEHFNVPADSIEDKREGQCGEFQRRIAEVCNGGQFDEIAPGTQLDLAFEVIYGRPKYSIWVNSKEFQSVTVKRNQNRNIKDMTVTRFFELYWKDFCGKVDDLRYDPSLFSAVDRLERRGYSGYLDELKDHLSSVGSSAA